MVTTYILRIFNIPFSHDSYAKESEQISGELAKADIVHLALNALKYLSTENIPIAVQLMSRLVFTNEFSKAFA